MPDLAVIISLSVTIGLIALAVFNLWFFFRVRRPLVQIVKQVSAFQMGDFSVQNPMNEKSIKPINELGLSLNQVADQLNKNFKPLRRLKDEMNAIFASMTEGVIALNKYGKVMHTNQSAAVIFDKEASETVGRSIEDVLTIPEIQEFVSRAISQSEPAEQDVEIHQLNKVRVLQMRSSSLKNARGKRIGTVLGFSDITQLRRLESHRRDFVANVSHELRTPLTSIQGFAETLMNPSVTDPKEIRRFLEIIHRHAARLGAIIDDILTLSRIEREVGENVIELTLRPLRASVAAAVELCEVKAKKRNVKVEFDCPQDLNAEIDPPLLEQALVNLIDNALKYSEAGQTVKVEVSSSDEDVVLSVTDQGSGIPKHHFPRLFERFYRVDKARSRKLGGTGLGLSIVKHVCLAHKGRIEVASELGHGSQFSIHLPRIKSVQT